MKTINQPQERLVSILGLKVEGISSKNTDNVRQALVILLQNNLQVFKEDKSPQEILQMLEFSLSTTNVPQKPKGAELADYFRTHSMSAEAGKIMNEARKEFREGFAFKHDLGENE